MNKAKHDRFVTLVSQILTEGSGSMHILPRGDIVVSMFVDDMSIVSQAVDMAARARLAAKLPTPPRPHNAGIMPRKPTGCTGTGVEVQDGTGTG